MKYRIFLIVVLGLAAKPALNAAAPDLILFNGSIFTSDPPQRFAQAIAIGEARIVAVDTSERIQALAGPDTRRIDLHGHVVVPGFNDAHYHHVPNPPGRNLRLPFPEPTWAEALAALSEAVKQTPNDTWVFGAIGSVVVNNAEATRATLDGIAPQNPVLLQSWFGHGHLVNSAAMRKLGVADDPVDLLGGYWERDPGTKRVTGKFFEYTGWPLFRKLENSATDEEIIKSLQQMATEAVHFGVTSIQVMTYVPPERYVELLRRAQLPIRVRVIRWPPTDERRRLIEDGRSLPLHPEGAPNVTVRGTKYILDGTPLERGMAVRTPYLDRPEWRGRIHFSITEIESMLRESIENKDQLLLHAVGDRTIETVLNAMETVDRKAGTWPARRVRIEHADGLLEDLVPRAKELGVIVVQNPTHFDPGMTHVFKRFGSNLPYLPLRSLLEAGIRIALGSDGPMNPGLNIMFASLHPTRPKEAITREQAVEAYTHGSAFAEFEENEKGKLARGQFADLAVLSQDIFQVPPSELPKTESILTIVGGKVVYDSGRLDR